MSTDTQHELMPPTAEPPLARNRWLIVGADEGWLARLDEAFAEQQSPILRWRQQQGLIVTKLLGNREPNDELERLLCDALSHRPGLLTLVLQPGLFARVQALLDVWLPQLEETDMQVRIGEHLPPFDGLLTRLTRPDSRAVISWLDSGRRRLPTIAAPGAGLDEQTTARHAFREWAEQFESAFEEGELDAIYGGGSVSQVEQSTPGVRPNLTLVAVPPSARLSPGTRASAQWSANFDAPALHAASGSKPKAFALQGFLDPEPGATDSDGFTLTVSLDDFGKAIYMLAVELKLAAERWRSRRGLVVEVHAPGQLPCLLEVSEPRALDQPSNGIRQEINGGMLKALRAGPVKVMVTYRLV